MCVTEILTNVRALQLQGMPKPCSMHKIASITP